MTLSNFDIICVSSTDWDAHWGTQQQIMTRLSKKNRIFFLEVPISPLSYFTGLRKGTWVRQIRRWIHGIRQGEGESLFIGSPPPLLPFRYHKITNYFSQRLLAKYIERETEKLSFKEPLLVTFQADSGELLKQIQARLKIYYCTDDWAASGRWWQPYKHVREREKELVSLCNLIFATSGTLTERLSELNKSTYFLPNAVDYDLFSKTQSVDMFEKIRNLRRPIIGFNGMITPHSFDPELVNWLIKRNPSWQFLIVGKEDGNFRILRRILEYKNVFYLGFQPKELLPSILAGMDVCIIPWRKTEWTQSSFSLKLFEYLAAGKPVVATWTKEYLPYENLVYLANNFIDFEIGINLALKEDNHNLVIQRMKLAKLNTWDNRVEEFSKIVNSFLG
jgi:glycosyltransferase involved in cell wall biosynthesis